MQMKPCWPAPHQRPKRTQDASQEPESNRLEQSGFDEEAALAQAGLCLGVIKCENCDLCCLFCPDLCVTRNAETGNIEIDYDFCKGCGICAWVCPRGAIKMVLEE